MKYVPFVFVTLMRRKKHFAVLILKNFYRESSAVESYQEGRALWKGSSVGSLQEENLDYGMGSPSLVHLAWSLWESLPPTPQHPTYSPQPILVLRDGSFQELGKQCLSHTANSQPVMKCVTLDVPLLLSSSLPSSSSSSPSSSYPSSSSPSSSA